MSRYFLKIAYNGTRYHGWQIQENGNSVQAEIEHALSLLNSHIPIPVTGCGRTDTGVHAKEFFLHFDLQELNYTPFDLLFKLNRILPRDIAAYDLLKVENDAHARFDAVQRTYRYYIHQEKDPFLENLSWFVHYPLDMDKMNQACGFVMAGTDFAAFCKSNSNNKTTRCKISEAYWERKNHQLIFTVTADRFLRNMVRAIVGTMILIGKGALTPDQMKKIIESRNRSNAGESVPACGLFLTKISYPYF